ncbi:MAG: LysR family transcriptional regulator [Lachnospiraceae bacterium]|nr:LysR family transcriptional regulator [Lachnospiraceae bacterium]
MTIRHLKVFTAVADMGGMSAAAKKLHVSQPTVSQAIAELEKYYGVKLFERLSQKLYLTKEGELMLSFSRHILDSFNQMEEAMDRAVKKENLRIGCSVTVGTCLINDILDQAGIRMPHLSISVVVANSSDIERAILCNEVDIGIVEGILKSSELLITPVCKDELVIVCGSSHPLAKEKTVTPDMLAGQNYISRESGSAGRNQLEKLFEEQGLELVRTFCSTNTEAIKNAVIRGRGIAVLSERMIERERAAGDMVVLPVEGVKVTRNINLAIHKNKYLSKSIKMMQEIVQETF